MTIKNLVQHDVVQLEVSVDDSMLVRKYDQTKTKKDHNSKHEMTAHIKCYLVKKEDSNGYLSAVESEQ